MFKVKHERECDCVVAGFRWHAKGGTTERSAVGSLLLGLYDDAGKLQHVGVAASFTAAKRIELVELQRRPIRERARRSSLARVGRGTETDEAGHRVPGVGSRWSQGKDLSWEPLRAELVGDVAYGHMQASRGPHTAPVRRWRPDKNPHDCTYAQLEVVAPHELAAIFAPVR